MAVLISIKSDEDRKMFLDECNEYFLKDTDLNVLKVCILPTVVEYDQKVFFLPNSHNPRKVNTAEKFVNWFKEQNKRK